MKKICILTAGGTIGMIPNEKDGSLQPAKNPLAFLKKLPDLTKIADIHFEQIMNIDSSNMEPSHWTTIAEKIYQNYKDFDGFVVIQGTDTMAYTASALSFVFQNLGKPIVFTGSLLPAFELGSDAISNLIYACLTASQDIAEVCLVFSNKIYRANRSKKYFESFLAGFHSPVFPHIGILGRPITLNDWRYKKSRLKRLKFSPEFEPKVGLIKLYPGFSTSVLDWYLEKDYRAIFIEGFGSGNIPFLDSNLVEKIKLLSDAGIVVVVGNQMEKGKTNLHAYQAGKVALENGAISNYDMTSEATLTKLMWLCAKYKTAEVIKKNFQINLAGELTETNS